MSTSDYMLIGSHAEDLGNGQTAEVGQVYGLTSEDLKTPAIKALVEEGKLIPSGGNTTGKKEDKKNEGGTK